MNIVLLIFKQKSAMFKNNRAFTLIEALLALSIFSTLVFFITPMLQVLLQNIEAKNSIQGIEWDVFCSQIKKEIRVSSRAVVITGRLYLTKDSDTIIYEKYGSNLRRRVNSTGHEILLQNVAEVTFTVVSNSVKIVVKDVWGKEYSFIAYSLMNWNQIP